MNYIRLKNSDLTVSRIAMGGCPMGGHGWGKVVDSELYEAIDTALDSGINFFDTADVYGLGKSELILGKALEGRRNHAVIATKFGVRITNGNTVYDNSPEWIEEAAIQSLKRLRTDYIDLYQVHYRDETPAQSVLEALERLQKKGYIRFFGLSNISADDTDDLKLFSGKASSFQDEYSLAQRKNEDTILKVCSILDATPMTWGSLGQGILSGKYDERSVFEPGDRRRRDNYVNFHGEKLKTNMGIVQQLKEIANILGESLPAVAIGFILTHIKDSVALVGAKNAVQIKGNARAADVHLTKEQIDVLLKASAGGI